MKKATLALADLHYGDAAHLHLTLNECMLRAIQTVQGWQPDECEVVIAGDAVSGRGVYRNQDIQNALPIGAEQCWYAAHDIADWQRELRAARWVIVLGNHDNTNRENLAIQLATVLRLMAVPTFYAGRSYVGNFAGDDRPGEWYEVQHGRGHSDYYANSYAAIRDAWRQYIERSKADGLNLSRMIVGHTHWLNVGQSLGDDYEIDTLGGWHRQERLDLPSYMRGTGMILYRHDGQRRTIDRIEADTALLRRESRDVALHYQNMRRAGHALEDAITWAHEQGLA